MSQVTLKRLTLLSLRVGNLTFGGGEPTMAVFQRELVSRRGWLSSEQYGLAFGLARITPGTNLLAFCAGAGWMLAGWRGAAAVTAAVTLPSAVLVLVLTHAYQELRSSPLALGAIAGIVAAAVGMMAAAAWGLARPQLVAGRRARSLVLLTGSVVLSAVLSVPPIPVLALAALTSLLWRGRTQP